MVFADRLFGQSALTHGHEVFGVMDMRLAASWARQRCHAAPPRGAPIAATRPA